VRGCAQRGCALAVINVSADPTATDDAESPTTEYPSEIEKVERTDVGVSVRCTLKRGTGTRDQDEIRAKVKAETVADATADLEELKPHLRAFAQELREIQPSVADDDEEEDQE